MYFCEDRMRAVGLYIKLGGLAPVSFRSCCEQNLSSKRLYMSVEHSDEFKRDTVRIALMSGLTRRPAPSDLSIGFRHL